jgi:hypothetical protein
MKESYDLLEEKLQSVPIFCFTGDLDWASESMIQNMLDLFSEFELPLTIFITHDSDVIRRSYCGSKRGFIGLHPNFFAGSTQGNEYKEIISNLLAIWPEAKCFRSHSHFDHYYITHEFSKRGFHYDSNICLHLQSNLVPLKHASGLLRFPVFLQDNHYATREGIWDLSHIKNDLKKPGLKVFNFHPVHIALNTPNIEYYENLKEEAKESWSELSYNGKGVKTFLMELLQYIKDHHKSDTYYLDDIFNEFTGKGK